MPQCHSQVQYTYPLITALIVRLFHLLTPAQSRVNKLHHQIHQKREAYHWKVANHIVDKADAIVGVIDAASRDKEKFICTSCGHCDDSLIPNSSSPRFKILIAA